MISFPNAKINLGLFVTEKRADGFHNIETVLFPIPLFDALEITDNIDDSVETHGRASLHAHGIKIDGNPNDNLVYKAYQLLKTDFDIPNIRIDLLKKIPFGAGLGGGSADATFMLKLLNEKFALNLSDENLENYARKIGSDCAFFVKNKPAFAYEKGDKFEPIDLDLSGYQLVLICPPIHVCTKTAYQNLIPTFRLRSTSEDQERTLARNNRSLSGVETPDYFDLRELPKIPVSEWKNILANDFEPSVFAQHPTLADIKQNLYDLGADYAAMSGSGSAIFGLFSKDKPYKKNERLNYQSFVL